MGRMKTMLGQGSAGYCEVPLSRLQITQEPTGAASKAAQSSTASATTISTRLGGYFVKRGCTLPALGQIVCFHVSVSQADKRRDFSFGCPAQTKWGFIPHKGIVSTPETQHQSANVKTLSLTIMYLFFIFHGSLLLGLVRHTNYLFLSFARITTRRNANHL